jgi:hypothetical protein
MQTTANELTETPADKVTYQIFKFDDNFNHWMLKISGSKADCPHQSVAVFPTTDNHFVTIKQPCTTQCPLARIWKGPDGTLHYEVSCGEKQVSIDVTEEEKRILATVQAIVKPM